MSTAILQRPPSQIVDEALLQEIVRRIVERFHPCRIILFGSRARGEPRPDSDVDLFVEMETDRPRWQRRHEIDDLFPRRWWSMDLLVYTPAEVARGRDSLVSIIPVIETEGRVLYERPTG